MNLTFPEKKVLTSRMGYPLSTPGRPHTPAKFWGDSQPCRPALPSGKAVA